MSDLKKIGLLFLVCLILAVYAKLSGNAPVKIGTVSMGNNSQSDVLGSQTYQPSFGHLVPK